MIELAKEHGKLNRQLEKYKAFRAVQQSLDDTAALGQTDDTDLRDLAHAELPSLITERDAALEAIVSEFLAAEEMTVDAMILEIRAGTGGDEAGLFAGDLVEMYRRYCEAHHFRWEVLDFSPGDAGGFRDAVISVKGEGAYRALAYESGGHRVQRVPQTETQGRIHTSAATVAVLPEADESAIVINPADVREDVSRSGGPGGQGVNKIESAVQLTHLPTNIVVRMREERSQHKNREKAWRLMRSRVFEHFDSKRRAERAGMRKQMIGSGERNERVRTYSFPTEPLHRSPSQRKLPPRKNNRRRPRRPDRRPPSPRSRRPSGGTSGGLNPKHPDLSVLARVALVFPILVRHPLHLHALARKFPCIDVGRLGLLRTAQRLSRPIAHPFPKRRTEPDNQQQADQHEGQNQRPLHNPALSRSRERRRRWWRREKSDAPPELSPPHPPSPHPPTPAQSR